MRPVLAFLALAAVASPAFAEEIDCTDPQTQTDLTLCAQADFDMADEKLNALYTRMRERLAGDDAKLDLLRDAQRAWIAYRDTQCAFQSSGVAGGSAEPMVAAQCLTAATVQRNGELEALLACEEGDVACPVPAR